MGKIKCVIYAMISNFQNRIEVLTNLLEQIENFKQLKAKKMKSLLQFKFYASTYCAHSITYYNAVDPG